MREFNCVVCGRLAIDKSLAKNGKYCSDECRNRGKYIKYIKGIKKRVVMVCKYKEGVDCLKEKCDKCGWNPEVEKRRKETLYGRQTEDI